MENITKKIIGIKTGRDQWTGRFTNILGAKIL